MINIYINIFAFVLLIGLLYYLQKSYFSFSKRVFAGLGLGILYGAVLQLLYGSGWEIILDAIHGTASTEITTQSTTIQKTNEYINIVGAGYVKLLQMIIMPLIMVSIVSAMIKLKGTSSVGKISSLTIGILIFTTMIAAIIGVFVSLWFGLSAEGLTQGSAEIARGESLNTNLDKLQSNTISDFILNFIPSNIFYSMAGQGKSPTIGIVIFSVLLGMAATGIARKQPEIFNKFQSFVEVAHALVMRLVTIVLRLTPFGVLALMSIVVSGSNYADIINLISFVAASYIAILLMFIVHLILIVFVGLNPVRYLKKIFPLLVFSFTSRSSAGAIPMNVQTQTKRLGVSEAVANFSASFGSTIGQNGCAGIYPAMLAVMIAPTVGVPIDLNFIISLILIITISSFGVAGVGGGATFAALIVLSSIGFPVALVGLLISIEPLIDMGRTALNVSGSVTAGTLAARFLGEFEEDVFKENTEIDSFSEEL